MHVFCVIISLDQPASINSQFSSVDHTQSLTTAGIRRSDWVYVIILLF